MAISTARIDAHPQRLPSCRAAHELSAAAHRFRTAFECAPGDSMATTRRLAHRHSAAIEAFGTRSNAASASSGLSTLEVRVAQLEAAAAAATAERRSPSSRSSTRQEQMRDGGVTSPALQLGGSSRALAEDAPPLPRPAQIELPPHADNSRGWSPPSNSLDGTSASQQVHGCLPRATVVVDTQEASEPPSPETARGSDMVAAALSNVQQDCRDRASRHPSPPLPSPLPGTNHAQSVRYCRRWSRRATLAAWSYGHGHVRTRRRAHRRQTPKVLVWALGLGSNVWVAAARPCHLQLHMPGLHAHP